MLPRNALTDTFRLPRGEAVPAGFLPSNTLTAVCVCFILLKTLLWAKSCTLWVQPGCSSQSRLEGSLGRCWRGSCSQCRFQAAGLLLPLGLPVDELLQRHFSPCIAADSLWCLPAQANRLLALLPCGCWGGIPINARQR